MHELICAYPLATLVTHAENGLNANHIPLHLDTSTKPYGALQGHVARANPLLTEVNKQSEVLAVFHGPNAYITPSWYATKKETGKVVPTWNYVVVHAYGKLRIIDDTAWLFTQLSNLTDHNEAQFPEPWSVNDAPEEFTEKLLDSIIGIEITITRLEGKWKVSQNQPERNQQNVIAGLNSTNASDASIMAEMIKLNS